MNQAYVEVVPSDTAPLPSPATAIYVGSSGDLAIRSTFDSDPVVMANVPGGRWLALPSPAFFVLASATTASDLIASLALSSRALVTSAGAVL